jgi:Carboxypeptidase regulatory-like domain
VHPCCYTPAWRFSSTCELNTFGSAREFAVQKLIGKEGFTKADKKTSLFAFVVVLMLASAPLPMRAQVTGGTITGTVTDTSGGAITNAEIYIKNTATGVTRNAAVSDAGLYSVPNLVPGPYQVSVSAMGFSNILKTGIILDVGATVTVNIAMAVGNVNQTIEVKEDLTDVEISTSTLSGVLNGTIVREGKGQVK